MDRDSCVFLYIFLLSSDNYTICGKFVEIVFYPEFVRDFFISFSNLDNTASRLYDSLDVIGNSPVIFK